MNGDSDILSLVSQMKRTDKALLKKVCGSHGGGYRLAIFESYAAWDRLQSWGMIKPKPGSENDKHQRGYMIHTSTGMRVNKYIEGKSA